MLRFSQNKKPFTFHHLTETKRRTRFAKSRQKSTVLCPALLPRTVQQLKVQCWSARFSSSLCPKPLSSSQPNVLHVPAFAGLGLTESPPSSYPTPSHWSQSLGIQWSTEWHLSTRAGEKQSHPCSSLRQKMGSLGPFSLPPALHALVLYEVSKTAYYLQLTGPVQQHWIRQSVFLRGYTKTKWQALFLRLTLIWRASRHWRVIVCHSGLRGLPSSIQHKSSAAQLMPVSLQYQT